MFNRKLKRRLRSLEDFFGIAYSPKFDKHDDAQHFVDDWGSRMVDLDKMLKEWREKKK